MACAISSGSPARVTAVASSTASQPSSIACAASDAVPMPASRTTGTPACSTIIAMLCGLRMPSPVPIGEPSGMTAAQPTCLQPPGEHRVVVGVGQHGEAVVDELLGGVQQLDRVGQQGALVGDDLELDQVGLERLAGQPRGEHGLGRGAAARGVGQHLDAEPAQQVEHAGAGRGVDAAHRDGRQLGAGRDERPFEHLEVASPRRCP